jgi:cobalt-zinc-cadmium resistance protein CzcA
MLKKIIRFSVHNKLIIGLFTLALIGYGVFAVTRLPIDAVPDITNNQVQVITISPSLAAPEIERLITFPIEQSASTIPGIQEIRSFSRFGLSLVTIVFSDATDVYWARQQVTERLQTVRSQIPTDAGNPELAPVTTGLGEIFQYAVRPKKGYEDKYNAMELRTIQDWIIRRYLLGTPGVADVSSFGGYLKQYEVSIQPAKLQSLNVTINDVFAALQQNNQNTGGSYIEKGPNIYFIRSEGLATSIDDISRIVVKNTSGGIPVLVRDIAEVKIGHANRYGAMCYNDQGEVAGAVVMMLKGENSSEVITAVKKRIAEIEKTLPDGVMIEPFLDRSKMVGHAIGTVKTNLLEGALIVVFILVIFLGNLRAGLIVASVIPLAMLFAIIMMNIFGVSGNLMSLGALDFGLIVDGAVIIVEAMMHRLHNYKSANASPPFKISRQTMDETVVEESGKMMGAAVFGQIIILIVYLPILSLVGIEGKMFKPMAQTVSFALIGAFILSLTYVPMISSLVLSKKIREGENWSDKIMTWLQGRYRPALQKALQFPKMIVFTALLLFAFALILLSRIGGEFIPELEEGDFAVDTRVLTGSSLNTTIEATQQTAAVLLKNFPEVEKVVTKIGSGEIPTDPMPIEASDMMVILKDKSEWTSAKTFDEMANKMSLALQQVPGVTAGFQFPVQMRFNELMTGARQDVVCKIFGEDLDTLAAYSKKLGDIINTVDGARDLYLETVTGLPQIVVHFNREAIALFRLNIADVNRVIRTAFAGESAGLIYENERRFDLVVRVQSSQRKDISDIQQLLIPTPGGGTVPLYQLATVELKEGPNQIQREDARRRIVTGFNVRGRDVQSIVEELQDKVNKQIKLPPGYLISYGGQFQNLVEANQRLSVAVPVALFLILIILYFAFRSIAYGILIFTAIPLSAIGGVYALYIRDMPFSISAGVGFIALFGVAVLNGIVLITAFNHIKKEGIASIKEVVLAGTKDRLRPVLMTAAVASLGFLPMALSNGAGAEVQRPLATVVIGGLVTATFLTLFVLPILYVWLENFKSRRMKKRNINITAIVIAFVMLNGSISAQTTPVPKTLDEMIAAGRNKNIGLQSTRQQEAYWKALQSNVYELPKTQILAEYGGINSFNNDTKFSLLQNIAMPVVYKRQSALYLANENALRALQALREKELAREISLSFYAMVDLQERDILLSSLDCIFRKFAEAADRRLKAGETNILEKTTADAQLQQIIIQRQQLNAEKLSHQKRLEYLLNTDTAFQPQYTDPAFAPLVISDSSAVSQHPALAWLKQQTAVTIASGETEKNKMSPEWIIGYSNQSIKGWQSPDGINQKFYSGGDRFHTVQAGIAFPLFNAPVKARLRAAAINRDIARLHEDELSKQLSADLYKWSSAYQQKRTALNYYNTAGLEQARIIASSAQMSFEKGAIDYLQWSVLMNQVIQIRLGYIEALREYNEAAIHLSYYFTN